MVVVVAVVVVVVVAVVVVEEEVVEVVWSYWRKCRLSNRFEIVRPCTLRRSYLTLVSTRQERMGK